jgi:hypothetical protein
MKSELIKSAILTAVNKIIKEIGRMNKIKPKLKSVEIKSD